MSQRRSAIQDQRFKNVTVYSGGQSEQGTLYLTQHHLRFTYLPKAPTEHSQKGQHKSQAAPDSQFVNGESATSRSRSQNDASHSKAHTPRERSEQPRIKEIWVPYPMINFCLLRPSHAPISRQRSPVEGATTEPTSDDEDLFPPVYGTASYERPSTDFARLGQVSFPARPSTPSLPVKGNDNLSTPETGRQPSIRIRRRDFQMMAFHFHPSSADTSPDENARQAFFTLRSRCCLQKIEDFHAFDFTPPKQETSADRNFYDSRREYARMGVGEDVTDGPGTAWRISTINQDYSYSPTYPRTLCVPRAVSDNMLKYGGVFRSRSRIPCLTYLHSNGGSITRSSQPMVGVQNKRNPQDERLVSAIFSSHVPGTPSPDESPLLLPTTVDAAVPEIRSTTDNDLSASAKAAIDGTVESGASNIIPVKAKVYGSSRQNLIADARPRINALANRASGGGIEDVANYMGSNDMPIQKVFLNIANIHVMRSSLEKIVESLGTADYLSTKPSQEALRRSGWLEHIAGVLEGSEMVARVVGLGGSHVLVHCSDGWDRTAQVAALAQVMLDPHYRTFNGFIALIEKDFLSFGHKFCDRNGIEGSEKWFEIENERITPSPRGRASQSDQTSLNALSSKAFSSAKNWFEKGRGSLFRQQDGSRESLTDQGLSPPPNPIIHSQPTTITHDESSPRTSTKEIAPIFHQFLDAVYQLLYHQPDAFEFNERFLRRLFYHTYSCQYGEFLFNTERERRQYEDKLPSIWGHFNSRRTEFVNPTFVTRVDDPLLFPRRHAGVEREIDVRWWSSLFRCADGDMNVPRPVNPTAVNNATANEVLDGKLATLNASAKAEANEQPTENGKDSGSIASFGTLRESFASSVSNIAMRFNAEKSDASSSFRSAPGSMHQIPTVENGESKVAFEQHPSTTEPVGDLLSKPEELHTETPPQKPQTPETQTEPRQQAEAETRSEEVADGDPLGVASGAVADRVSNMPSGSLRGSGRRPDFAAFAAQNAFQER